MSAFGGEADMAHCVERVKPDKRDHDKRTFEYPMSEPDSRDRQIQMPNLIAPVSRAYRAGEVQRGGVHAIQYCGDLDSFRSFLGWLSVHCWG